MRRELVEAVEGCWQMSEEVIFVKIAANPIELNIIQVYAPTSAHRLQR